LGVRVLLLALALVAAGCGGGGDENASPEATQTSTRGRRRGRLRRHFGYIRSVSAAGGDARVGSSPERTQKAAEEDGAVPPGEPVPNDYYIRNPDKTTRTLRIANDAKITAKRCRPCRNGQPGELGPFLASFMEGRQTFVDPYRGKYSLYWLTIEDGEVVAIDEQYVP
jgi:hypothetical protein